MASTPKNEHGADTGAPEALDLRLRDTAKMIGLIAESFLEKRSGYTQSYRDQMVLELRDAEKVMLDALQALRVERLRASHPDPAGAPEALDPAKCEFCDAVHDDSENPKACVINVCTKCWNEVSLGFKHATEEVERLRAERSPSQMDELIAIYEDVKNFWSAQCFDWTHAPETMKREAHTNLRDGLDVLAKRLYVIVGPTLKAEFAEASRLGAERSALPTPDSLWEAFEAGHFAWPTADAPTRRQLFEQWLAGRRQV